jgi:hypothetical protein
VIRRGTLAVAACVLLLSAGCGGGAETTSAPFAGPDPAGVVPADAPFFLESVVRPEGDQKTALEGALSKLLATDDPGGFIVQRLDEALRNENAGVTYEDDIQPWLGSRGGIFFETFTSNARGAFILSTTDAAASQKAIDKAAAADQTPERTRTYKGVDYKVDNKGTAVGIVGSFVVFGPEAAFRDAVDAAKGSSLTESIDFTAQLAQAPDGTVAFAYADPQRVVDSLEKAGQLTAAELKAAGSQVNALLSAPASASVSVTSDRIALDASAAGSAQDLTQASSLLRGFPGDSWFAFAAGGLDGAVGQALQGSSQQLGFDVGSQLSNWAGDVGGFARGTSVFGLGGALVVESDDEQASAQTLSDLQRGLSPNPSLDVSPLSESGEQGFSVAPAGVPIQLQFVQREGKVIAGLGSESVDDVFAPSSTLDDSDSFKGAADALGSDFAPLVFWDFEPMFELVNGIPDTANNPGYQQAKPYLDHLDYLAVGARSERDRASVRTVLGLRESSSDGGGEPTSETAASLDPSSLAR